MFEDILLIVKKAGIFLILGQTILHLCAGDTYEKYIKMLVGLVTAALFISPILELFQNDGIQSFEEYRIRYEEKIFEEETDFEEIRDESWWLYFMEETEGEGYEGAGK